MEYSILSWKIDKIEIKGTSVLAPMAKITDLPFRLITRKFGVNLAFTEMVNSSAVSRGNKASHKNFYTIFPKDRPLGIQIFGSNLEKILKTAKIINEKITNKKDVFLDINFGCPGDNVLGHGAGSALLKRPKRMIDIVSRLISNQDLPITAKIRLTTRDDSLALKTAKLLADAGVSALTIHARTIKQKNFGPVDLDIIKKAKNLLEIPIIGNGGIGSQKQYDKMLNYTNCDAVMIGKAAINNPGIFSRIGTKKDWYEFSKNERIDWLSLYNTIGKEVKYFKLDRVKFRAMDFLRNFVPKDQIEQIFKNTKDEESFIEQLRSLK